VFTAGLGCDVFICSTSSLASVWNYHN